ncbi:S-layer homology domain-containing protein [Dapis sp. BLCC M126]|uniref:WD40 domain-containing protein n=1 Tax=Dapis sp. BLCC M126 TaxID=3400189 RepID=UPI003CF4FF38
MIKIYKLHPILALVVALSTIITPELFDRKKITSALAETTLQDIENHFAQACINSLLDKKIILGDYENKTFRPNAPVNRSEFAAMITKAFPDTKLVRDSMKFVDIPQDYWAYDAIQKSYEMGFLSSYIGKAFNPTLKIKRWQVLAALSKGLNYQVSGSSEQDLKQIFDDAEAIPEDGKKAIAAATEKGIVVNYPNVRMLNPNQDATRSDVATFLCQAITNNQKNNDTVVAKVPSKYIANFSRDTRLTTTATVPEKITETTNTRENAGSENPESPSTENTNSQSTTEVTNTRENAKLENPESTSTENINPPAMVERFGNGNLQAEIIYEQANNTDLVSDLRLKIIRSGEILFNEPVPVKSLAGESDSTMAVLAGRFVKVQLLDLDGNGESEVLIDLFTINNSNVPFAGGTYSLIYRYKPTENKYTMLRHYWGNINYRLKDLDNDNIPEFQSVDSRFANVFSNVNDSVFPIRIWEYRQGEISDVTKKYPAQINTNASEIWLEFYRRSNQNQNVKGVLAAYLANKYMLGEKEDGWKLIEKVYKDSDRAEYFASLRQFLTDQGYDTNQQIRANVIVPENSTTESQETVSSATNETSLQPTTENTENRVREITIPPQTSSQTTTENTETQITIPPQPTTENTETQITIPPQTSSQTTTENIENTETQITRPPQISDPTPTPTIAANAQTLSPETAIPENSESETQPDISNDFVLAPRLVRSLSNQQPDSSLPVVISFNGKILASSRGKDIQLWNLESSKLLDTLSSHTANVHSVAISPDGKTLASGSADGTVKLWDIPTGEMLTSFLHSGIVTAVGFTADGRAVVGCSAERGIKLWNIYTGRLLHTMNATQPIAFGANGLRMATSGGPRYIRLWNVAQGQLLKNLSIPSTNNNQRIEAIAFSQDGQTIAHAMRGENQILVWDVETWEVRHTLEKHSQAIKAIAISPDGNILASSSEDGKINLWDIDSGKLLRSIKGYGAIVFSPDSQQLVSVAEDNTIQLWRIYGSAIEQ